MVNVCLLYATEKLYIRNKFYRTEDEELPELPTTADAVPLPISAKLKQG